MRIFEILLILFLLVGCSNQTILRNSQEALGLYKEISQKSKDKIFDVELCEKDSIVWGEKLEIDKEFFLFTNSKTKEKISLHRDEIKKLTIYSKGSKTLATITGAGIGAVSGATMGLGLLYSLENNLQTGSLESEESSFKAPSFLIVGFGGAIAGFFGGAVLGSKSVGSEVYEFDNCSK
ncbi:MAG: hypothetical protein DWQ06_15495 [Calditrichaeota bacterium]|nr:MAG: hypothetical protein DWQ06_15495 [Calditrichota bacterium]